MFDSRSGRVLHFFQISFFNIIGKYRSAAQILHCVLPRRTSGDFHGRDVFYIFYIFFKSCFSTSNIIGKYHSAAQILHCVFPRRNSGVRTFEISPTRRRSLFHRDYLGNTTWNVVPTPSSLSAHILPLCTSTMSLLMYKPIPVPP